MKKEKSGSSSRLEQAEQVQQVEQTQTAVPDSVEQQEQVIADTVEAAVTQTASGQNADVTDSSAPEATTESTAVPPPVENAGESAAGAEAVADTERRENIPAAPPPATQGNTPHKETTGVIWAAIALAVASAGLSGFAVWKNGQVLQMQTDLRTGVAQKLQTADDQSVETSLLLKQQRDTIEALKSRISVLDAEVAKSEGRSASLEKMYGTLFRSQNEQILAEVGQTINIAAQQLQLAGNVDAALTALKNAEARLSQPDLGQFVDLRRAILRDIDEIQSRPRADITNIALRLEIMQEKVDQLPLAYTVPPSEQAVSPLEVPAEDGAEGFISKTLSDTKKLAVEVWNDTLSLVRLERVDQEPVLLSPSEGLYLRENIKIHFLTARLALLARDGKTFSSDLAQSRSWIAKFFDVNDAAVKQMLEDLDELSQLKIQPEQFSLTESFAALKTLQKQGGAMLPSDSGSSSR